MSLVPPVPQGVEMLTLPAYSEMTINVTRTKTPQGFLVLDDLKRIQLIAEDMLKALSPRVPALPQSLIQQANLTMRFSNPYELLAETFSFWDNEQDSRYDLL